VSFVQVLFHSLTDLNLHCVKHFGEARVDPRMTCSCQEQVWDEDGTGWLSLG
jgi:hypothetical protein